MFCKVWQKFVLLVVLVFAWLPIRAQQHESPHLGNLERISADGIKLAISCKGQGSPSIIIEPGSGDPGNSWKNVQNLIAKFTKVCWYSRAGLGKSDSLENQQHPTKVARQLHALLRNASIDPPYILVGHSIGGLHVRKYQAMYPQEVKGMILVDSSHQDQWAILSGFMSEDYMNLYNTTTQSRNWDEEAYGPQLKLPATLYDLPLVVLTGDKISKYEHGLLPPLEYLPPEYHRQAKRVRPEVKSKTNGYRKLWLHLQKDLARLSTNSRHYILKDSGHFVHLDNHEKVVEAAKNVFEEISK
ncbi:MAG: alpha/beta fold hydrolase [Bacteroidetes bacterium]|nr:alpha/beta fold hydrolase [Bacteroidota bacterium]